MTRTVFCQPITQANYAPYGGIISTDVVTDRTVTVNNGTARRTPEVVPTVNRYAEAPSQIPARTVLNVSLASPREVQPWQDAATGSPVGAEEPASGTGAKRVLKIKMLERHPFSTQSFIPMGAEVKYLVVVTRAGEDAPDLEQLHAFVASDKQGVCYGPGVWHAPLSVIDHDAFACDYRQGLDEPFYDAGTRLLLLMLSVICAFRHYRPEPTLTTLDNDNDNQWRLGLPSVYLRRHKTSINHCNLCSPMALPIKSRRVPTAMALVLDEKSATEAGISSASSDQQSVNGKSDTVQVAGAATVQKPSPQPRTFLKKVQAVIWDDPDKPEHEKKFLRKLDFYLLTYTCMAYFCKNLDQANINNAYVSGMQEAINFGGNDLTYASNCFTAGYVISQLPVVILATKVRPSYLVSTLEVLWAVFTFCSAAVKTPSQLFAMRFLVGLCEGAFFPSITYLITSWYTRSERGKRTTLFYSTSTAASMFSGYLQAAAYKNLSGKLGHEGWQWLFIVCGVISLPIGILGYFFNPDFPETTRAFYLSKEEVAFARQRLIDDGYQPLGHAPWTKTKILKIVRSWQFWVLSFGYFFVQSGYPAQQPAYALWLKSTGHSVYEVNVWPTGQSAIGLATQILAGMISDSPVLKGKRWQPLVLMQGFTVFGAIVLAVWNVPDALKYVCFYLTYTASGVPGIFYAWFPDLIPMDHEMRGFMIAFSNIFSYINQIWYADAFWRTSEKPRFKPGFIAASVFGSLLIANALLMRFLQGRDTKARERQAATEEPAPVAVVPASAEV
ncbi:major facilitator superfamily transporter [Niveomyces insectorum RCEF 264]|uniref:Major facilitator superfamily transporter n=1 Tax=Niveomyces insectorum RCEF 264 TaxID=1081102 RepID=A0A167SL15_9HYPO|nr:major facilitator superfamily transporter [Niveomyces insectorum RCEF 264]